MGSAENAASRAHNAGAKRRCDFNTQLNRGEGLITMTLRFSLFFFFLYEWITSKLQSGIQRHKKVRCIHFFVCLMKSRLSSAEVAVNTFFFSKRSAYKACPKVGQSWE